MLDFVASDRVIDRRHEKKWIERIWSSWRNRALLTPTLCSKLSDGQPAYYLLGYAIECALEACGARQCHEHEIPDRTVIDDFYTHRPDKLLGMSGVKGALESRTAAGPVSGELEYRS